MRPATPAPRGASLLTVLIVLTTLTLLVTGALTFTGAERRAAVEHTHLALQSGCVQAARNLFLARVRALQGNIQDIRLDEQVFLPDGTPLTIRTGHYSGSATLTGVQRLPDTVITHRLHGPGDLSNRVGTPAVSAAFYAITATCRDAGGREQEVEFAVRVGL